jgi:hypothetical protein
MEVSGQLHAPATLPPGNEPPGTHWIEGWVGPTADMDAVENRKILHLGKDRVENVSSIIAVHLLQWNHDCLRSRYLTVAVV